MQILHKYNAIRAINAALLPAFLCFYCIALPSSLGKRCILHPRCITSTGAPPYKMQPRRNSVKEENATSIWSLSSSGDVRSREQRQGRWKHKELTSVVMRRATSELLFFHGEELLPLKLRTNLLILTQLVAFSKKG